MQLTKGTEPYARFEGVDFESRFQDGRYYNIPREYFEKEGDIVRLDSRIATQLEWHIDADLVDEYNIACSGGFVEIDGERIGVNPGFWCSNVQKEDIKDK
jgi:hypothetical protein